MNKILTSLIVSCAFFAFTNGYAQHTKYGFGVVEGSATVQGNYHVFMYYTQIDKIDCPMSKYTAQAQLKKEFSKSTSKWNNVSYNVYLANSYSEAQDIKISSLDKVKSSTYKSMMTTTKIENENMAMDFECPED